MLLNNMDTLSKDVIAKIKRNISHNNIKDVKEHRMKGTLTIEHFFDKIKQQGNECYICLQEFKYDGGKWCYFFPSADRIYNRLSHTEDNIAISCLFCNIRNFKQVSEKKCSLCEGLHHTYDGTIIKKGELFRSLENNNYLIKKYINNINISKIDVDLIEVEKLNASNRL